MAGNGNGTAVARTLALQEWDAEFARLVKTTLLKPKHREATSPELAMFAEQVQRTGLDPFLRQIYGIYRKDKTGQEVMTVQVGIDGFRLIAERTGKYQGQTPVEWCDTEGAWTDVWLKQGNPAAARVGVYKAGHIKPTFAVAHWREYVDANSPMWKTMGANQLAKCAEALALRKDFPAELSGLYTPEEMAQADVRPAIVSDAVEISGDTAGGKPTAEQVEGFVLVCEQVIAQNLMDENRLMMRLVDASATDTTTWESAALSMPTEAMVELGAELNGLFPVEEPSS